MISTDRTAPAEQGFRMPAEWHPHEATWLAWPHNRETWPENLREAQTEFVRLVETIARGETACVVASGEALAQASDALSHIRNLQLFDIPVNDSWIRDFGPTFVISEEQGGRVAGINWQYNGWGEKYPPWELDVEAAAKICEAAAIDMFSSSYVIEGGALEINDRGELLTTISCLLNFNRNPVPGINSADQEISDEQFANHQADVSRVLAAMTGAASISWLSGAEIPGDDTDGHIDQQVRFADSDSVIVGIGYGPDDPMQPGYETNIRELGETFGASNRSLQGMDLPMPPPMELYGRVIPASYLNFYVCNYGVIVPQYDCPLADARALDLMKAAFPGRRIVGLPSLNLSCGLGSFHCLTQQQPAI